jgi:hypothetical protein
MSGKPISRSFLSTTNIDVTDLPIVHEIEELVHGDTKVVGGFFAVEERVGHLAYASDATAFTRD